MYGLFPCAMQDSNTKSQNGKTMGKWQWQRGEKRVTLQDEQNQHAKAVNGVKLGK